MQKKNCSKCGDPLDGKHPSLCKKCAAKSARVWYSKHKDDLYRKEQRRKYQKEYYQRYSKEFWNEKVASRRRKRRQELRTEIFQLLGNKCQICSFSDQRILEIDHINGGGKQEIKHFRAKSWNSYLQHVLNSLKANEEKYRLLCPNCNRLEAWRRQHSLL